MPGNVASYAIAVVAIAKWFGHRVPMLKVSSLCLDIFIIIITNKLSIFAKSFKTQKACLSFTNNFYWCLQPTYQTIGNSGRNSVFDGLGVAQSHTFGTTHFLISTMIAR